MSERKKCKNCERLIKGAKARRKQTKYCAPCAAVKKKENTENPWLPEEKRDYMRPYMRAYRRAHPGLSTPYVRRHREKKRMQRSAHSNPGEAAHPPASAQERGATCPALLLMLVPMMSAAGATPDQLELGFEAVKATITNLELLVLKATGLALVVMLCWQHLAAYRRRGKGE